MEKYLSSVLISFFMIAVFHPEIALGTPINSPQPHLVADKPEISFSTFWGGSKQEDINDVVIDSNGNIYVTGVTNSKDLPTTNPVCNYQGCNSLYGDTDAFVAKFDSSGTLVFSTYFGGSSTDSGNGITIGQDGNIYIVGTTNSYDIPGIIKASGSSNYQSKNVGTDAFIAVMPSTGGSITYSMYVGGADNDEGNKIYIDKNNIVTIAMHTKSDGMPILNNIQTACGNGYCGNSDGFIFRYINQSYFAQYYGTFLGGSGDDSITDLRVDDAGNIILTGWTTSTDLPLSNATQASNGGSTDAVVATLTPNDIYNPYSGYTNSFTTYLGGSSEDKANGIDIRNGNIFVAGYTASSNFPTLNPIDPVLDGSSDVFVTKYNLTKQMKFSTYFGGRKDDQAYDIRVNSAGELYIVGSTNSDDFHTVNPIQSDFGGVNDGFIIKTDNAGSFIYSTYLGGKKHDEAYAIGVSNTGVPTAVGYTQSDDFPTKNAVSSSLQGNTDGFITNLTGGTATEPAYSSSPPPSSTIIFDNTLVGDRSTRTLTVSNTGLATLNVSDIALSGTNASAFSLDKTSFSIASGGASEAVTITCTPATTGTLTGSLTVTHNATGSPAIYSLTCTGTEPVYSSTPSPGTVGDFGDVKVGTSATGLLLVRNTGTATLNITDVRISGTNASDFSADKTSFSIDSNGSGVEITITATPGATGIRTATLSVFHNASGSPATYSLIVNGVEPVYISTPVSSSTINFIDTVVNSSSTQTLTVGNTGTAELTVSSIAVTGTNASDFSVDTTSFLILEGGGDRTVNITCKPTASGSRTALITVTHNASGSPATYNLSCNGIAPIYTSSPSAGSSISFGDILVESTSNQTITITNTGTAELNITSSEISGIYASDFTVTPKVLSLSVAASQPVTITCTPDAGGMKTATLTIKHNADGSPAIYSLQCNGIAPVYASNPAAGSNIVFDATVIGSNSQKTLEINNTGTATLNVANAIVGGTNASEFTVAPTSLSIQSGGGAQQLTITCTPTGAGMRTATLTVTHDAKDSPSTYTLTCFAVEPPVFSSVPSVGSTIDFADVIQNTSSSKHILVTNTGGAILKITDAVISGTDAAKFTVSPTSYSLTAQQSQMMKVTCSPTDIVTLSATLTVTHNAIGSPISYLLTCNGVQGAGYGSNPKPGESIDFGNVIQGDSPKEPLIVYNTGDVTLSITNISITGTDSGDFTIETTPFDIVKDGIPKVLQITCTPSALGIRAAKLTITHSATGSPAEYILNCTGVTAPIYSSTPVPSSVIALGDVEVGSSAIQTLTVSNTGGSTLQISSIGMIGSNENLATFSVSPTSFSISAKGASQDVTIICSPSTTGSHAVAMQVFHNAASSPAEYTLTCSGTAPIYRSTPDAGSVINFGGVLVGSNSTQKLGISDTGAATLLITDVELSGNHASAFSVSSTKLAINAGETKEITMTCTPSSAEIQYATLTVKHNASGSPSIYRLVCVGVAPIYASSPIPGSSINFIDTSVGSTSNRTLKIENSGSATLNIITSNLSGANAGDFSVQPTSFSIDAGGGTQTVTINCTPSSTGVRSATLTITHDASGSPATYSLLCNGISPIYTSTPSPGEGIKFGDIEVGSKSSQTLTVSNTGTDTLNIIDVEITGPNAPEFNVSLLSVRNIFYIMMTGVKFSIPAGGRDRNLSVSCNPIEHGSRVATLRVFHNASGSPAEYPLTCHGIAPVYDSTPPTSSLITFPETVMGTSSNQIITVNNIGDAKLVASQVYISGSNSADFAVSLDSFTIYQEGGAQTLNVVCTPSASGERTAMLIVEYNAYDSPARYRLSCVGIIPVYSSVPVPGSLIDFGDVTINTTSHQTLDIKNVGRDTLNIVDITITGANASVFTAAPTSFSLASGSRDLFVIVSCTPSIEGLLTATLTVMHNAVGSPATYDLSCGGAQNLIIGSTANATVPALKNATSPDEILSTVFTDNIIDTTYEADGIQTIGMAVPHSFDGLALLATKLLPSILGGMSITVTDSIGGKYDAGIFSVSPREINWLMPSAVADGLAVISFYKNGNKLMDESITVARTSPGMFTANATGSGLPVAMILRIKIDGSEILEPVSAPIDLNNKKDQLFLVLCGTGFRHNSDPISATIGGRSVQVFYSGPTADNPGLDQINLQIPHELSGSGDVVVNVSFGGKAANPVTINIK